MARIMSYDVHNRWVEQLLAERFMEPMEGCKPTTFAQMMAADRELFRQLAERTGEGVRPRPDGFLPCDVFFPEIAKSRRVDRALTSVQVTGNGVKRDLPSDGAEGEPSSGSAGSGGQQNQQTQDRRGRKRQKRGNKGAS